MVSANNSPTSLLTRALWVTRLTRKRFLHAVTRPFNPFPPISLLSVRRAIICLLPELVFNRFQALSANPTQKAGEDWRGSPAAANPLKPRPIDGEGMKTSVQPAKIHIDNLSLLQLCSRLG